MDENGQRNFLIAGLSMTLALIAVLGFYASVQSERMEAGSALFQQEAIERAGAYYVQDCADCHGSEGEGVRGSGPPLNTREFLGEASDGQIANTIADGRPGSSMPAWGQSYGGPYNAQVIDDLVIYIRAWEKTAPSVDEILLEGDVRRGAVLFASTCFACHGISGEGTDKGLRLNDPERLARFGDDFYREVIARGRPSKGMPTWGSVLAPIQIEDIVVYMRSWESSVAFELGSGNVASGARLYTAACATCHGLSGEGVEGLGSELRPNEFIALNDGGTISDIIVNGSEHGDMPAQVGLLSEQDVDDLIALLRSWQPGNTASVALAIDPSLVGTYAKFLDLCAECHGETGEGGEGKDAGPALIGSEFVQNSDEGIIAELIARGNSKTGMPAFRRKLNEADILDLITLLRSWQ